VISGEVFVFIIKANQSRVNTEVALLRIKHPILTSLISKIQISIRHTGGTILLVVHFTGKHQHLVRRRFLFSSSTNKVKLRVFYRISRNGPNLDPSLVGETSHVEHPLVSVNMVVTPNHRMLTSSVQMKRFRGGSDPGEFFMIF
jgi:hypothetical protein